MRRTLRILAAAVALGAVLLVVAGVVRGIDLGRYRGRIIATVRQATGRELALDGDLELRIGPHLTIEATRLRFANAPWAAPPDMLTIDRAEAKLQWLQLLQGTIDFSKLVMQGVHLELERDAAGTGNWQLSPAGSGAPAPAESSQPSRFPFIEAVRLSDVHITYRDAPGAEPTRIAFESLKLAARDRDHPMQVDLAVQVDGQPIEVRGRVGAFALLRAGEGPYPLSLAATGSGFRVDVDGRVGELQALQGIDVSVDARLGDPAQAARLFGGWMDALPRLALKGHLSDVQGGYAIDPAELDVAGAAGHGRLALQLGGARPKLSGAWKAAALDLSREVARAPPARAAPSSRHRRVISDAPLPLAALAALDADLQLAADHLQLAPGLAAETVEVDVTVQDGRGRGAVQVASLQGGPLRGELALAPPESGRSSLAVRAQGVPIGSLLSVLGLSDRVRGGPSDIAIDLAGRGTTVREVASSLDGSFRITVGAGTIDARALKWAAGDLLSELVSAINPLAKRSPSSELRCAALNGSAAGGVLQLHPGLGMRTAQIALFAAGTVDLASEGLDLAVRSDATGGLRFGLGTVASRLVRVRGTLAAPSIRADPIGAASAAAQLGANLASSGFSLLLRRNAAEGDICQRVAEGRASHRVEETMRSAGDRSTRAAGDAGRKIEKGLKGLLRR